MVVADTEAGDDLELRESFDEGGVDARVTAADGDAANPGIRLATRAMGVPTASSLFLWFKVPSSAGGT
jgi:hypothetical protein